MSDRLLGRRVLVVEDEVMVSWILEDMLAELGCQVIGPAARVDQALAMVDAETIDLAVLDVNLNGQKSFPVADALVARGVPFVFDLTSQGRSTSARSGPRAGVSNCPAGHGRDLADKAGLQLNTRAAIP